MNEQDRLLALEIKKRLPRHLLNHVKKIIVFGSRARGKAVEDSDLDLAILVDKKTPEIEKELEDIIYQIMWDHDFRPIISLKVFSESRFYDAAKKGYSFYRTVEREGIPI